MDLTNAIYDRRSVRSFTSEAVSKEAIDKLIAAAVQAPSAMNSQPWAFSVIQDSNLLRQISSDSKAHLLSTLATKPYLEVYRAAFTNPDFDIFYNTSTLLTIYAKPEGPNPANDCAIAAQNVMLMAHSLDLGTCWIGFAQMFLNLPEIKEKLNVPPDYTIIAPLIVGHPTKLIGPMTKKEPELLFWK